MSAEPIWLTRIAVGAMHAEMIREHGGSYGVRDDGLIESALARPQNRWGYGETELAGLAAAYGFGLAKNHGFIDGNKRVALMAAYAFLYANGLDLDVAEPEAHAVFNDLAAGELGEEELAAWIRSHVQPVT
jgi:death-on-curing protein